MSYYGVGDGWCFSCGGFAGRVKLMFINGTALKPVPPVTPVGMGKATRGDGDQVGGGSRRTADRGVDEAGRGGAGGWGEEAVGGRRRSIAVSARSRAVAGSRGRG